MVRIKTKGCMLFMALIALAAATAAQSPKELKAPAKKAFGTIYIETQIRSWTTGYRNWLDAHPAVILAHEANGSGPYMLRTPFLDYFAPGGKSIYSNSSPTANIEFLRALPKSAEIKPDSPATALQPTLAEYLNMLPELKPYKSAILARNHPVVIAICLYSKPECVQQNQALQEFKRRAPSMNIQVIEVKLLNTSSE